MIIKEIGEVINRICPLSLAETWDNSGFQVSFEDESTDVVITTLEVTDQVIDFAIKHKAKLIISHHPLLFNPLKSINNNNVIGNHIIKLINNRISVYSCHTNFDKMDNGLNDYFGELLQMENVHKIEDDKEGFVRIGTLKKEMLGTELAHFVASALDIDKEDIRLSGNINKTIKTCAWCTGAGSDFIDTAFSNGADCYITGDLKYHQVQETSFYNRLIIDAGHYGTEKIFSDRMNHLLNMELKNGISIIPFNDNLNPFLYI